MESAIREVTEKVGETRSIRYKRRSKGSRNWRFAIGGGVVACLLIFAGIFYFHATRFQANVTINGIDVGGLTADQALKLLESTVITNKIYVGQDLLLDGKDTEMGVTDQDLPNVQKLLKSQHKLIFSSKAQNFTLIPSAGNLDQSKMLKQQIEEKLNTMNQGLDAPKDAQAYLEQGKIVISKSKNGRQYNVAAILQDYEKQKYNSEIHLKSVTLNSVKKDSPIIKNETKILKEVVNRTVNYTVQGKVYTLKGSDIIKNATVSKKGEVSIDPKEIKNEITKINDSQSNLNKNFQFKTHSGSIITVKGQTFGWALNIKKEAEQVQKAFEKGENSVTASHVYGNGWDDKAIGFNITAKDGIGSTYAEVSIQDQRIWLYKNGQMVLTTNVVTGRHDVDQDTHPGVWYILYKRSPAILEGSEVGMSHYRVPVNYWAPFTNDGQGFHDASWRSNWSSTAYLHQGSGGCVNTPSSIMKQVYDNLSVYEPVIIY